MTPRAVRPALARARAGGLSDARLAVADTFAGGDDIDGIGWPLLSSLLSRRSYRSAAVTPVRKAYARRHDRNARALRPAAPNCRAPAGGRHRLSGLPAAGRPVTRNPISGWVPAATGASRSEERRVGKECRSRWSPYH